MAVIATLVVAGGVSAAEPVIRPSAILQEQGVYSCLSPQEAELLRLVNSYRTSNGLAPIENSKSLNKVARLHALDLVTNAPFEMHSNNGLNCSLHSWSDKGYWTPVCYIGDRRSAELMWNKPREITRDLYYRVGFENVYWTSESTVHPPRVLEAWKNSPAHRDLILETGKWKLVNLRALGVGVYKNVAIMWVGNMLDPLGPMTACRSASSR